MLKKKAQVRYFNDSFNATTSHLFAFAGSKDPEELHKMRIEIKKIFFLFNFIETYSKKSDFSDCLRPFRDLYKTVEILRNAQVNLQIFEKYKLSGSEFKLDQQNIIAAQTIQLSNNYLAYFNKVQESVDSAPAIFSEIENKKLIKFFLKKLQKLTKYFDSERIEEMLHTYRKIIKQTIYTYEILPASVMKKLRINTFYLDRLQESIGNWHDVLNLSKLLIAKKYYDKDTIIKLEHFKNKLFFNIHALSYGFASKVRM